MKNIYKKHNSFSNFKLSKKNKSLDIKKIINILRNEINKEKNLSKKNIFEKLVFDLNDDKGEKEISFKFTPNVIEEIKTIDDNEITNYLFHRYRYEIFPQEKTLDDFLLICK